MIRFRATTNLDFILDQEKNFYYITDLVPQKEVGKLIFWGESWVFVSTGGFFLSQTLLKEILSFLEELNKEE